MPYCENCGNEINNNAKFCPNCGCQIVKDDPQDGYIFSEGYIKKTSVFGIIGFVGSLIAVGLYKFGWLQLFTFALPALVFSIIGLNDKRCIKKGFSYAGLGISILSIVICFWEPPFMDFIFPI